MTYSSIRIQVERDILIAIRGRSETFNSLVFFMVVILLFGLGIGPVGSRLSAVGPAALWVVALFANMLSVEGIFRRDFETLMRATSRLVALSTALRQHL